MLVGEPGAYRLVKPVDSLPVPPRSRRCWRRVSTGCRPEEKRLLQTAAVIGTEVPLPLLQAIAELPEEALHRGLAHLQAAEFLYETRLFPDHELHLQARPDPRGGLRQSPARAAARAACPHRRGA